MILRLKITHPLLLHYQVLSRLCVFHIVKSLVLKNNFFKANGRQSKKKKRKKNYILQLYMHNLNVFFQPNLSPILKYISHNSVLEYHYTPSILK